MVVLLKEKSSTAIDNAKAHLAAKRGQSVCRLQEVAFGDYTSDNVDRESCVIRNVKVLGKESRNGRTYSDRALDAAAELYEGIDVFFDHRDPSARSERSFQEGFATLRGCKVDTKKGAVFADLHYLSSHPLKEMVLERIERNMKFGLSHDAEGEISPSNGGGIVVNDIKRVHSVDIVLNPATNAGLFESLQPTEEKRMNKSVIAVLKESAKQGDQIAKRLLEMEDVMDLPVDGEMSLEPEASSAAAVNAAVTTLIGAVIADESISPEDTKKTVGKIMDAVAPSEEPAAPVSEEEDSEGESDSPKEEEDKMAESVKVLRDELKSLRESFDSKLEEIKKSSTRPNVKSRLSESQHERPSGTLADYFKSAR